MDPRPLLFAPLLLGLACSNDVVVVTGSGSTGALSTSTSASASSGAGGAEPTTHEIEIAVVANSAAVLSTITVLLNHVDGSLVQSWSGAALPVKVIATDGDFVTYARGITSPRADSFRVEKGVDRIETTIGTLSSPGSCDDWMYATVHVPAVPGATAVRVAGAPGEVVPSGPPPVDLKVQLRSCDGSTSAMFVAVEGPSGWLGFQWMTIPFVSKGNVDVTPTLANEPRTKISFDVDGLEGAMSGEASARYTVDGVPLFEPISYPAFAGAPPPVFHAEMNLVDVPIDLGSFVSGVRIDFPGIGACGASATIGHSGPSDAPLLFHVADLGAPVVDGASWKLTSGAGDVVRREFNDGQGQQPKWTLVDDPHTPRPAVFPTFPPDQPFPAQPYDLVWIQHDDYELVPSYAAFVATSAPELGDRREWFSEFPCE